MILEACSRKALPHGCDHLVDATRRHGRRVFMVSWRNPDASMEGTTIEDYEDLGPLAASDVVREISRQPDGERDGLLHRRGRCWLHDAGMAGGEGTPPAHVERCRRASYVSWPGLLEGRRYGRVPIVGEPDNCGGWRCGSASSR